jgi:phosphohistidine phosphatase SixA
MSNHPHATFASLIRLALTLAFGVVSVDVARASEEAWALLKKPGHTVLLRHAYAPGVFEDPPGVDLKNCKLQRNLDESGRAQARRIGAEFRKHGHKRVRILSSQFCRTLETARLLGLGPVEPLRVLNYLKFDDRAAVDDVVPRTIKFMKSIPARQLAVLVTHISNVKALTAITPASGEGVIVHFDPKGNLTVAGRIPAP